MTTKNPIIDLDAFVRVRDKLQPLIDEDPAKATVEARDRAPSEDRESPRLTDRGARRN